nr:helix-turn-helix domain-containing protein [Exilispira sp.]
MVNHNGNLTINEAVKVTGKSISSLYRLIKSGKLQSKKVIINGKELLTIKNEELVRVFNIPDNHSFSPDNHTVKSDNHSFSQVEITEKLEAVMERFFERKQAELVKPMEQQLLYQAGVMAKENQFLKEKVETLLLENRELQDQLKALPDLQADLQQEKEK